MDTDRRDFFKAAGAAALTTSLFTGRVRGANDKVNAAFIGMGKMGRANLSIAMRQENLHVSAVCDIFQRNLDMAVKMTNDTAKPIKDFRDDTSLGATCPNLSVNTLDFLPTQPRIFEDNFVSF